MGVNDQTAAESKEEMKRKAMLSVQSIFDRYRIISSDKNVELFDRHVMRDAKILDASLGPPSTNIPGQPMPLPPSILSNCVSSLHIDTSYGNLNGVMHGGAAGVIFDMLTTIALAPLARPGYWDFLAGVTRSLNISYLKAVPIDTTVYVHSYVYQIGKTMAYIKGWMTSEDGRTVYAICDHHKVHVPTKPGLMEYKVPWDELWEDSKGQKGPKL